MTATSTETEHGSPGMWRMLRWAAIGIAVAAVVAYAAAAGWLWARQESVLFRPMPLPADHVLAREQDVREFNVDVPGARLSVLRLTVPNARGVVFYLHGNAGNLARWFSDAGFYRRAGYDLVMMDYRGFGKSSGRIESQDQLIHDVRAVWKSVAGDYAGRRVVLVGRSLGSGLVASMAAELTVAGTPPDLTVLVSPYTSMVAMAAQQYPWVPGFLLRYPLPTGDWLVQAAGPVLIAHGDADALIPVTHAYALKARVPRAQLVVLPGATHHNVESSDGLFHRALAERLAAL